MAGEFDEVRNPWLTVPNLVTYVRFAGLGVLLWLAWRGLDQPFTWVLAILLASDWVDGKLAILLKQRTALGARLDSLGDSLLYMTVVPCAWWLRPEVVREEAPLIVATIGSWIVHVLFGLARFRRLPAYHTRAAKVCWFLISVGLIAIFAGPVTWPLRVACVGVILTDVEGLAITAVLPEWRADVPSILHARRIARG